MNWNSQLIANNDCLAIPVCREGVRGYPGILGYPNISGFILWISPKKVPKFLFFNEGYPNIKFLTSSLTTWYFNVFYIQFLQCFCFERGEIDISINHMMWILEVHWTIELELKYIIVQHLCIVCEIHLSIKWTYESIQRECNISMIIISQKNIYLPFLRQEKILFLSLCHSNFGTSQNCKRFC